MSAKNLGHANSCHLFLFQNLKYLVFQFEVSKEAPGEGTGQLRPMVRRNTAKKPMKTAKSPVKNFETRRRMAPSMLFEDTALFTAL